MRLLSYSLALSLFSLPVLAMRLDPVKPIRLASAQTLELVERLDMMRVIDYRIKISKETTSGRQRLERLKARDARIVAHGFTFRPQRYTNEILDLAERLNSHFEYLCAKHHGSASSFVGQVSDQRLLDTVGGIHPWFEYREYRVTKTHSILCD